MPADRQETETQLDHLFGPRAIDYSVDLALAGGFAQFLANVIERLIFRTNDMIGSKVLGDGKLLRATGEGDDRRPRAEQLRVLDCVGTQAADSKNRHNAIRAQSASVAQLLDTPIRCHPRIRERGELLRLQIGTLFDLNEVPGGNGQVFSVAAVWPEPRPLSMSADVRVALLAVTACPVAPAAHNDRLVAFLEAGRLRYHASDILNLTNDFVTR